MASKDDNEKVLILEFINYLRQHQQFPEELWTVVLTTAAGNRGDLSTQTAQRIVHSTAEQKPELTKELQETAQAIPTRVCIQFQNEHQRDSANRLRTSVQNEGFVAPGIEHRPKDSPRRTEVRYFSSGDRDQADQAAKILREIGFTPEEKDLSGRYGGKVPLRQIEVWLGGQGSGASVNP